MARISRTPAREPIRVPEPFQEIWNDWIEYKRVQKKQTYATEKFEEKAFAKLLKESYNDPDIARQMIDNAISGLWQGFHPLKTFNNGVHTNGAGASANSKKSNSDQWRDLYQTTFFPPGNS